MTSIQLLPAMLSALVLSAHFLRDGNYLSVVLYLALLPLLAVRRPWAARTMQIALLLGAIVWVKTTFALVNLRATMGEPYQRMACILCAVAGFAVLSAILFQSRTLQRHYGFDIAKQEATT